MTYIFLRSSRSLVSTRFFAMLCCVVSLSALVAMQETFFTDRSVFTYGPGGILGGLLFNDVLKDSLGVFGSA